MKGTDHNFDMQLDRLVDGELSRDEYARVVSSLDQRGDGWKRCALAFLESQAMRKDLRAIACDVGPPAQNTPKPATWPDRVRWPNWLALAASLMLTFLLGRGSIDTSVPTPGPTQLAEMEPAQPPPRPSSGISTQSPGRMSFVIHDAGTGPREVGIPVFDANQISPDRLLSDRQRSPTELLETIRNLGHDVQVERHYVPVPAGEGRQVVVPIERLHVSPKTRPTY